MPTRKRPSKNSASLSLLNSIKPLPKDVLRTGFAELRDQKNDQLARKTSMLQKMAKSLGRAQGSSKPDLANPATARAVEDLLALHQKLASKKLQIPAVPEGSEASWREASQLAPLRPMTSTSRSTPFLAKRGSRCSLQA